MLLLALAMALHELQILYYGLSEVTMSANMCFPLNVWFPGILNYILWLLNRNTSVFFSNVPQYVNSALLQNVFWMFLSLLLLYSSI